MLWLHRPGVGFTGDGDVDAAALLPRLRLAPVQAGVQRIGVPDDAGRARGVAAPAGGAGAAAGPAGPGFPPHRPAAGVQLGPTAQGDGLVLEELGPVGSDQQTGRQEEGGEGWETRE